MQPRALFRRAEERVPLAIGFGLVLGFDLEQDRFTALETSTPLSPRIRIRIRLSSTANTSSSDC